MNDYKQFFPESYTPNKTQEFILLELAKAKDNGYKYVVINAPTGSGKGHLAKTLANSLPKISESYKTYVNLGKIYEDCDDDLDYIKGEGAAILTITKALQDQYHDLFKDTEVLKGQSNYQCALTEEYSCDLGICAIDPKKKHICIQNKVCEYYNQRDIAITNKCSLFSYSMFLSLPPACRVKPLLICDEAAELEDILVQNYTLSFNFKLLKKLKLNMPPTPVKNAKYEKYISWLNSVSNEISTQLLELGRKYLKKRTKIKKEEAAQYKALSLINDTCNKILNASVKTEFIIEHTPEELIFKPYKVDKLAQDMFKYADFVVLMSATIIDHTNFTKQLGINKSEYYYIEAPSNFDPKKAPIKLSNAISVTYNNKAITIPKLANIARQICELFKDKKGIIHTHSMDITNELKKVLVTDRFLFRERGITNEDIIQEHCSSKQSTVLVSPSLTHGLDLKGDLGEFAIIMKAPFLPLSDLRVKRLCEEDPEWYQDKMLATFFQMIGRTIRTKDDTSTTFVLDGTLTNKLVDLQNKIPKYILERFC